MSTTQDCSTNLVTSILDGPRQGDIPTTRADRRRVLISSGTFSVAHDAGDGTTVGTITTDVGSKTCSIVLGDTTHFAIHASTGAITVLSNVGLLAGTVVLRVQVVMADGNDEADQTITVT